jgi:RNA polymerase sigma factor (sigma-70 family)
VTRAGRVEELLRALGPEVLGALVRRFRQFDACEDAVQEALLAAAVQWPRDGVPDNPRGWLVTVASRRMTDLVRSEQARRRREDAVAALAPTDAGQAPGPDVRLADAGGADLRGELGLGADGSAPAPDTDDTLRLLFLCCHPALSPPSQLALTLRAVGGLTTAEIARAFLVPEATMAQRISRAKQTIRTAGATFALPPADEREERLRVVLHVLYLMFNEGYTSTSGPDLQRSDLTAEAVRLTRTVHRLLPDDSEVAGLLALMVLTEARRAARTGPAGELVPLAEQDRGQWDRAAIAEGVDLITRTLSTGPIGPYQLQAAIAAVHDEAATADDTDWPQILALYELLTRLAPNPVVTLNHAVATAMVKGPAAGLAMLAELDRDPRLAEHHRLHAVRAHLLELDGDTDAAREAYREAARRTSSRPERRYLETRAARLTATGP